MDTHDSRVSDVSEEKKKEAVEEPLSLELP